MDNIESITLSKSNSHSDILLPDFHYVPSLRARDSHDQYVNPSAMAQYYQIPNIKLNQMHFDYSFLLSLPVASPIANNVIFNDIYFTPYGLFGLHGSNIILTSSHPLNQSANFIFEITNNQKQIERIYVPMQSVHLLQKNVIGFQSKFKNNTITEIRYAITSNNFKDNQDSFIILYQR